jgi:hypothetical protein
MKVRLVLVALVSVGLLVVGAVWVVADHPPAPSGSPLSDALPLFLAPTNSSKSTSLAVLCPDI